MGDALRAVLPFAGAIAVSPVTIALVLALLLSRQSRARTQAFLAVWFVALAGVVAALLWLLPSGAVAGDGVQLSGPGFQIGIGVLLVVLAGVAAWRAAGGSGRHRPLMAHLDSLTPLRAAGVAAVFALNPKNLALVLAGVAAVTAPGPSPGGVAVVAVAFATTASIPLLVAVGVLAASWEGADQLLDRAHGWLTRHGDAVTAVVLTVIGAWMLLRGLT